MRIHELGSSMNGGIMSVLANKPMWVFWVVYSALSGVLFGVFYTATYLLALRWWVAVIVIIAIGMVWGSLVYTKNKRDEIPGKKEEK